MKRDFAPVHPGEILSEEFLGPMGISQYQLAKSIAVPALRISQIVRGKRSVTADTALRLSKYFGLNDGYWLRLQARFDEQVAKQQLARELARIEPLAVAA
jgi:addiction module HigA family antidote